MMLQRSVVAIMLLVLIIQIGWLRPSVSLPSLNHGLVGSSPGALLDIFSMKATEISASLVRSSSPPLLFVGDVMLARNVEVLMARHGTDYPYRGVAVTTNWGEVALIGNFESAIPPQHLSTKAGELRFSVDPAVLPALRLAGFTHVSLANNHALDHGLAGYTNAKEQLHDAAINPFGNPLFLDPDSVEYVRSGASLVAVIGYQTFGVLPTRAELTAFMARVEERSDLQILYVHWGNEYELQHSNAQEQLAKEFIAAGVDLIIGHHPHVVQDVGLIDGVPVFYSLGNFIFDQYLSRHTEEGLMVELDLSDEPVLRLFPVTSLPSQSQPQLMTLSERSRFLEQLGKRSSPQLLEYISQGYIPLNSAVATSTKVAMMGT